MAPKPTIDENTNRFTTGQGFTYDENGNIITDTDPNSSLTRSFVFNGDNKQTEVKKDGVTIGRYFYDGEGKRVKKVTDDETTVFVYSSGKLVAEYSTQLSQTPTVVYTTTDHLGTPRIITNELGNVKARRDFLPFGEEVSINVGARSTALKYGTSEDDVRQKFTGYQKDKETGLDFAEARMYQNRFGRFTAVDPLLASGKNANPQTFNRYAYVGNNPLLRVDPNGEDWYLAKEVHVTQNGRSYTTSQPYWSDNILAQPKWNKGIYYAQAGADKGKWITLDPWSGNFTASKSKGAALRARAAYKKQMMDDVLGSSMKKVAQTVDATNPITAATGLNEKVVDKMNDLMDVHPNEHSQVYQTTSKATTALIAVGTAASGLVETEALTTLNLADNAVAASNGVRSLSNLNSLRGATWEEAESLIPQTWARSPLKKGDGIRFVDPDRLGDQILLERGTPRASDPLHAGPYIKVSRNGVVTRIPLEGNPALK